MTQFITTITYTTFFLLLLIGCDKPASSSVTPNDLIVTDQCRPVDNKCELLGAGIKLHLQFKATPSYQRLLPVILGSFDTTLKSVSISMIIDGKEMPAIEMKDIGGRQWEAQLMTFAKITKDNIKIRLSVSHHTKLLTAVFPVRY